MGFEMFGCQHEWIVSVIKAMYEDATTTVRVNGRESKAFSVRVGCASKAQSSVHCCLSLYWRPCLESLDEGLPMELSCTQMILFWLQKQRSC